MTTPRTQAVTKSRQKAAAEGRKRLTTMLSAEGSALYARLADRYGSERELIEAALSALVDGRNEPTAEQIIEWVRRHAK